MEAQVWMTGRVGGEVDARESTTPWSTFRLACTPRLIRGGEWGDEQTTWVTVSCSNRLAEHVRLSLRKGDPVIVIGKLRTRRWVDVNGVEHEQLQIRASSVGHDLTAGTSSFYRVRRNPPAEAGEPPVNGSSGTDTSDAVEVPEDFEVPDFYPDDETDEPDIAAALAEEGAAEPVKSGKP